MSKKEYFEGVGRRKTSTSRVRIYPGKDASTVNGKPYNEYFVGVADAEAVLKPLHIVGLDGKYYFTATVEGGGIRGQIEAIQLGLGRAIYTMNPEFKSEIRKAGFATRDPRMVERKKYNQRKARKKPQFSKR